MDSSLWAFLGVSAIVIATPGPDTALTIRNTLTGGRWGGIATALGVVAGQVTWELATSAGLVAILLVSERVFHFVKLAGAVYLVALGLQTLIGVVRGRGHDGLPVGGRPSSGAEPWRAFRQGLFSNLTNPKMAVFFAGVFPQFVARGHESFAALMSLGLLFSTLTLAWLSLYAATVESAAALFRRPAVRRGVETLSGAALCALGLRLALEKE